ncbi:MAG: 3-phosphoshikimate 1-carboxyvinyltransferase [Prevotellaceae bacterium]|jgi:3-phosphoshikimate 1-carboxyvinyltransferase|nr:3-phosphoshikimate 1-carboxyvinyltransferase [Prevotellaceae bacterium]
MKFLLTPPARLQGSIALPASKSISNRALILSSLAYSDLPVENLSDCDDTTVMLAALNSDKAVFDIGAAGTSMRFLTAFLSKIVGEWILTGSERMKQRPIRLLVDALNSLGARIEYAENEGFPPLRIFGSALKGGKIELDGGVSSQYISALLMIAPTMQEGLQLTLTGDIISMPYIRLTLQMMEEFGVKAYWKNNTITIPPQPYKAVCYTVEADWSAASYWYEMVALCDEGDIFLQGLQKNSFQGDAKIAEIFKLLGVKTVYEKSGVRITKKGKPIDNMRYNFVDQPDMAQTFAVCCCMLAVPFRFSGLQSLKIKETDRIAALIAEMRKAGFVLREPAPGQLEWAGERCQTPDNIVIDTYDDHRMAMAFAPIALRMPLAINNPQVVTKSYPSFWDDLRAVGFGIEEIA